jgi:Na+/proline symporter
VFGAVAPNVKLTPKREMMIGRIVTILMIGLLVLAAFSPEGKGSIIAIASKGIGLAFMLLVPVIGPLFWPRATGLAASAALLIGVIVQLGLEFNIIEFDIPYGFGSPILAFVVQVFIFAGLSVLPRRLKT